MPVHRKVRSMLRQYIKNEKIVDCDVEDVATTLRNLLPLLGEGSQSEMMQKRIARLLCHEQVSIIAPSCPDYTHEEGVYTFNGLGKGVPLLAAHQIELLNAIQEALPRAEIHIVVADQERHDEALRKKVGLSEEEFLSHVDSSIASIIVDVHPEWQVSRMTERFPDLITLEQQLSQEISQSSKREARIISDTMSRADMYRKIGVYDSSAMKARTVRTAAQYAALAHLSKEQGFLVCNHETVNLSWFKEGGAAVLHNPVSIY